MQIENNFIRKEKEYEMTNKNQSDLESVERGEIIIIGNRNKAKKGEKTKFKI